MPDLTNLATAVFFLTVLATAVETILELFRGTLERFGFTWLKGKASLDELVATAAEFLPDDARAHAKLQALVEATARLQGAVTQTTAQVQGLVDGVKRAAGQAVSDDTATRLNAVAAEVRQQLDLRERRRVYTLRCLSAAIGTVIAAMAGFDLFALVLPSAEPARYSALAAYLLAGIAASSGSSYWHDKLDKVRGLKKASEALGDLKPASLALRVAPNPAV